MPLLQTLGKIFSSGAGDLIEKLGNVADKFIKTPEEKAEFIQQAQVEVNRHTEAMADIVKNEFEIQVADIKNARETNVSIQTTERASWLSKNVAYLIDAFVTLLWGGIAVYITLRILKLIESDSQPDLTIILAFWAGISTQFGTVLNFHRGSSNSSYMKNQTIKNLSEG